MREQNADHGDQKQPPLDLDLILPELGEFGRYQRFVFIYLALAILFTSAHNCQYVFNTGSVEYRCKVPQCESSPENYSTGSWGKFALPSTGSDCWRKVPIGKKCEPASFSNQTRRCYSWVYENQLTIVPEFDLACREWLRTLVGTIHSAGVFVAIPVTATISDAFGRRFALIGTSVAPAIFGVCRSFCNSYLLYVVLEFIEAVVGNCTYSTAFIMGLEIVGFKKRVLGGNIMHGTYASGQMATAMTAWALPYWRAFTLAIFAPTFLFVFYGFFVEESVRWLIAKGRRDEAVRIVLKMAKWNKVTLLPTTMKMLTEGPPVRKTMFRRSSYFSSIIPVRPERKEKPLFLQVLHSKTIMCRLLVVSFWWVSVTLIYYGLNINAVSLMGNKYINFFLTSAVEIPGAFLSFVTLDRFGRKTTIMISFYICGISLLILPAIDNPNIVLALTLVGKMMISLVFNGIYIYTIELFPTKARHVLMGVCSMTGRIGSMTAPQTPLLMLYMKSLPYLLFGGMAGCAGILMLLTPETLHMKLPDTIRQAEEMGSRTRKTIDIVKHARETEIAR